MITAIVQYKLPPEISHADCERHFHVIAENFKNVDGLHRKNFIWAEDGWAGGVYLWTAWMPQKHSIPDRGSRAFGPGTAWIPSSGTSRRPPSRTISRSYPPSGASMQRLPQPLPSPEIVPLRTAIW